MRRSRPGLSGVAEGEEVKFHQFDPLLKQILRCLKRRRAILDGEIVVLDSRPLELPRSHGPLWRASLLPFDLV